MFKLPEAGDYFSRITKVVIPKTGGGYHTGNIKVKFNYLSQKELDDLVEQDSPEDYINNTDTAEQIDFLKNRVVYGFEGIEIGERKLDDSNNADWDELLVSGAYSVYFRVAILNSFFASITDVKGRLNKKGNS